jgi:hypothetical protein
MNHVHEKKRAYGPLQWSLKEIATAQGDNGVIAASMP